MVGIKSKLTEQSTWIFLEEKRIPCPNKIITQCITAHLTSLRGGTTKQSRDKAAQITIDEFASLRDDWLATTG